MNMAELFNKTEKINFSNQKLAKKQELIITK